MLLAVVVVMLVVVVVMLVMLEVVVVEDIFHGMWDYVGIMKPSEQDRRLCKPVGYWHYTVGAE